MNMQANIKDQIEILVKLQGIETETVNIKSTLGNIPERLAILDADLKAFEQTIAEQESLVDELKKKYRGYESDAQINLSRVKQTEAKLRAVKTNKEYQSLLKEIEDAKTKNSKVEDDMIECLDRIDEIEESIESKKNEYLKLSECIGDAKKHINQEEEQGKKRLAALDAQWKDVSGSVQSELLKKYFTIKEQYQRGLAIVPAKSAVCHGCNVNLPPQLYNELHACDTLKFCPNCQRIIYLEESEINR